MIGPYETVAQHDPNPDCTKGCRFLRLIALPNGINDFEIADSMGNLGGIVVQIFLSLAILNSQKKRAFNVIAFLVAGYILYEIVQPYLPKGVFDWKDIYGTIIGGFVSVVFLLLLRLKVKNNRVFIKF